MRNEADLAAILYGNSEHTDSPATTPTNETGNDDQQKAETLFGGGPDKSPDIFEQAKAENEAEAEATEAAEKHGSEEKDSEDNGDSYNDLTDEQKEEVIVEIVEEHELPTDHELSPQYADFAARHNIDKAGTEELGQMHNAANEATWKELRNSWTEQTTAEFANDQEGLEAAKQLIQEHADDDLLEVIDGWGLGNHPALVRFLVNVAKSS